MLSTQTLNHFQIADSPSPTYWHDDCSSADGWLENTTDVNGLLEYVQTGIDLLTDGNRLFSDNIPLISVNVHGPQFFKKLPYPMLLENDLELQVEISHIGSTDCIGSVGIALLDQNNSTILTLEGYDNSYYSDSCNSKVSAKTIDGYNMGSSSGKAGHWTAIERVWYDSTTGALVTDVGGRYRSFISSGRFDLEREVHYIGLYFYCGTTGTYESAVVNDILLTTTTSESTIDSWFYDFSTKTGFSLDETWSLDGWLSDWELASGAMGIYYDDDEYTADHYCYFSVEPNASIGWHGPAFVHTLSDTFTLNRMKSFALQLAVVNLLDEYIGQIQVLLMDSNQRPVVRAYVGDDQNDDRYGQYFAEYIQANGSSYRHGMTTAASLTNFSGSMIFRYDETIGVSTSVIGFGEQILCSLDAIEGQREITHILILVGRFADDTYMPCIVDDFSLKWNATEPATGTETTTTYTGLGMIEYLTIGLGVVSIVVIVIVILKKRNSG